jgi:hypothetical protein
MSIRNFKADCFVASLCPCTIKLLELMSSFDYFFADLLMCIGVCYIKWLDIQKHLYYVHCNGCDVVYTS